MAKYLVHSEEIDETVRLTIIDRLAEEKLERLVELTEERRRSRLAMVLNRSRTMNNRFLNYY